jgi:hypothetical protein
MKYKIESDVEITPRSRDSELNDTVKQMKPGDSIVVNTKKERDQFVGICYRSNYNYATRNIPDSDKYRCWIRRGQNLSQQRSKNLKFKEQETLIGDDNFCTPSQIGGDLPEDIEPRGTFPQEILNEAIQRAREPFYATPFENRHWLEERNDFTFHDSNGDGRPLDFND